MVRGEIIPGRYHGIRIVHHFTLKVTLSAVLTHKQWIMDDRWVTPYKPADGNWKKLEN
jgi:hypothetical protein